MTQTMTQVFWDNQARMIVDDIGLWLVTLDHPMLLEPIRCASVDMDITSRGNLFLGWPMAVKVPSQTAGPKRGSLVIQNVDPRIGKTVRTLKGQISVLFEYVSRDDPDALMQDHGGLFFKTIDGTDITISGEIVGLGGDGQSWPNARATPERTPGLYVL